nr:MAG TPA_asm: hypothetical protein [Caudoviricetes sp.]
MFPRSLMSIPPPKPIYTYILRLNRKKIKISYAILRFLH